MATDYDAPRRTDPDGGAEESLDALSISRDGAATAVLDVEDESDNETFELPGADLSDEEFVVRVIPKQADEFTCASCFLVQHRSRLALQTGGKHICAECA